MTILPIFTYPSPVLKKKSAPVTEFDSDLNELIKDMAETMYDAPGVGLAAPQIGVSRQIIVFDTASDEEKVDYSALFNPKIIDARGEEICEEGCLSVLDYATEVKRSQWIRVEAQDIEGNALSFEAEDWLARILQHEIDHLNGILFIDHLSSLKRMLYKKKLKKIIQMNKEKEAAK